MVHCSILIPQRDAGDQVARLASELDRLMRRRGASYEILCVDDASGDTTWRILVALRGARPAVRLLRLEQRGGMSAAITAGIQAARGETVVLIEASSQYQVAQVSSLLDRLARADLVVGRRHCGRWKKLLMALTQTPRRMLLGLEVRDPDCLFWAARREAIAGIELLPGMHRFLGSLVTTRGFRVTEMHVDHRPSAPYRVGREARPRLGNLLAAWWQRRNWRSCQAREASQQATPDTLSIASLPPKHALPDRTPSDKAAA